MGCAWLIAAGLAFSGDAVAAPKATWPELAKPATSGGGENDAAVVIGIEKYAFVPAVPGALLNTDDWYTYLTKGRGVPGAAVRRLTDRDATVERMRTAAAEAAKSVGKGGTLWFVFVGHGAPAVDGKGGVLVGYDVQQNTDSLYARSLPQGDLFKALKTDRAANTVVIVDACFSGHTAGGELVPGAQPLLPSKPAPLPGKVMFFSAGHADEFAGPLPGAKRPAFSYLVLGALRGWGDQNKDGKVTADEVATYTRDALHTVLSNRTQTPELQGPKETVLVASAREAGPDLAELVSRGDETSASSAGDKVGAAKPPESGAPAAAAGDVAAGQPAPQPATRVEYRYVSVPANAPASSPPPGYAPQPVYVQPAAQPRGYAPPPAQPRGYAPPPAQPRGYVQQPAYTPPPAAAPQPRGYPPPPAQPRGYAQPQPQPRGTPAARPVPAAAAPAAAAPAPQGQLRRNLTRPAPAAAAPARAPAPTPAPRPAPVRDPRLQQRSRILPPTNAAPQ